MWYNFFYIKRRIESYLGYIDPYTSFSAGPTMDTKIFLILVDGCSVCTLLKHLGEYFHKVYNIFSKKKKIFFL